MDIVICKGEYPRVQYVSQKNKLTVNRAEAQIYTDVAAANDAIRSLELEGFEPRLSVGPVKLETIPDENNMYWYSSSSGHVEMQLSKEICMLCYHGGDCDDDVTQCMELPEIKKTLAGINPTKLAADLREYGAWDADQLKDHKENLKRILWIAAGDIREQHSF